MDERNEKKRGREKRGRDSDDGVVAVFVKLPGTRLNGRVASADPPKWEREGKRGMQLDVCTVCGGEKRAGGGGKHWRAIACVQGELARWRRWQEHAGQQGEGKGRQEGITRTGHAGQRVAR